jgi:cysteine-rich repeat protein
VIVLASCGTESMPDAGLFAPRDGGGVDAGPPCVTMCSEEFTRCMGDTLTTCADDGTGCIRRTETACDEVFGGFCRDDGLNASCEVDVCREVENPCSVERRICRAGDLVECAPDAMGCLVETATDCSEIAEGGFCDVEGEPPSCRTPPDPCEGLPNRCDVEDLRCDGDVWVQCAPDAFGCLVETRVDCLGGGAERCVQTSSTALCIGGPSCPPGCSPLGASTCDGPVLVRCEQDAFFCARELVEDCTDLENGFCDPGGVNRPAVCRQAIADPCRGVEQCEALGRTCDGETLVECALDASGCAIESQRDCAFSALQCQPASGPVTTTACVDSPCPPARTILDCASGTVAADTAAGTTAFAVNSCVDGDYGGPESAFQFRTTSDVRVTFRAAPTAGAPEHDLFVLAEEEAVDCSETSPCLGSDVAAGADGTVTVELRANRLAYVLYDQPAAGAGTTFDLEVTCEEAVCGDGVVGAFETCDDGGRGNGDGCDANCQIEPGFECLDGPTGSACNLICSNGRLDEGELCDDGNVDDEDGCDATCDIEPGYECVGVPSVCAFRCSNGTVDPGERCDDGNRVGGDGCNAACYVELGSTCTGSTSVCTLTCGDGAVVVPEDCDDGNRTSGDGCSRSCFEEARFTCSGAPSVCLSDCGDGLLASPERCDDGNRVGADGCSTVCEVEPYYSCVGAGLSTCTRSCGNGVIDPALATPGLATVGQGTEESCDDGNAVSGDGCNAYCAVERTFTCTGTPSVCTGPATSLCGNGTVDADETCDDSNTIAGDGCSFCASDLPGPTGILSLSGNHTTADPTWTRPEDNCTQLETATNFHYERFYVHNPFSTRQTYLVDVDWLEDGYLHVYDEAFDPSAPLNGSCITGNDDWPDLGLNRESRAQFTAEPGQTLTLVVSTFAAGIALNAYTLNITQPCGDGVLNANSLSRTSEECDDGNRVSGDGCSASCLPEPGFVCTGATCTRLCGNGALDGAEQCDDANALDGDGCTLSCEVEPGFLCRGLPGACSVRTCGDGRVQRSETCDDQNLTTGDGCFDCGTEIAGSPGGTVAFSGALDAADPTFTRLDEACGNEVIGRDFSYDELRLTNQTSTDQTVDVLADWGAANGFLFAMREWWNPSRPQPACLEADDDGATTATSELTITLSPGETIYLVATTDVAGATIASYDITVTTR